MVIFLVTGLIKVEDFELLTAQERYNWLYIVMKFEHRKKLQPLFLIHVPPPSKIKATF